MNRSLLLFILLLANLTNTFSQGQLWGLTAEGGSDNIGAIFKINEDGTGFSLEKSFLNDSERPTATGALVEINGKFYGVTSKGVKKIWVPFLSITHLPEVTAGHLNLMEQMEIAIGVV